MERIAVLGANSLIGQHLLCAIASVDNNNKTMVVWEMTDPFFNRLADNNNMKSLNVNSFVGLNSLDDALQGCDIVFNLHEVQDFSLMPNEQLLKQHNVEFVENLVEKCFTSGVSKLIHLSSVYLQCSARWPNVKNRECEDYDKFRSEVPFPAYCDSKYKAEQLIQSKVGQIQSISARVGPVYGEGDCCSLICDSILLSERIYQLPRIGDQNGVLQFVYAGNVAYALLKCADKLFEDDAVRNEIVLVQDHTPIQNFYDLALKPLYDESNRSINNRASASVRDGAISFYLFFPIYCMLCLFGWVVDKLGMKTQISEFPSPYYLYLVFHHWTFFSDFKLRVFFNWLPEFDYETSLQRSLDYYHQLKVEDISRYSWMPQ